MPAQAVEAALKPALDKRAELAAIDRRLHTLQAEHASIVRDQQRVRENMKALRGSAEEKKLLQRYTRQLDEQETRLEALQKDLERAGAARATAHEELSALFQAVSLDLTAVP
jgi:isochorismate hydrolase